MSHFTTCACCKNCFAINSSCCVDEVAASHYKADSIIHYGHSCLSPSNRLPTLYVFGKGVVDVSDCSNKFKKDVSSNSKVLVLFSVEYNHVKSKYSYSVISVELESTEITGL